MKKLIIGSLFVLMLVGCGGSLSKDDIIPKFGSTIEEMTNYQIDCEMQALKGSKNILFDISVYVSDDNCKVVMKNKENNTIQVLLKNQEGVFVLTPTLNKSFKFQSDWPENTYHAYLLNSVYKSIISDADASAEILEDSYEITSTVVNKYDSVMASQKVILNKKDLSVKSVMVYDANKNLISTVTYTNYVAGGVSVDEFDMEKSMSNVILMLGEGTTNVSYEFTEPDILFEGTSLKSKVEEDNKCVYFYSGSKEYTVVIEKASESLVVSNNCIYDSLVELDCTIGAISDYSLTWYNNGMEFQIVSSTLTDLEKIAIANSL